MLLVNRGKRRITSFYWWKYKFILNKFSTMSLNTKIAKKKLKYYGRWYKITIFRYFNKTTCAILVFENIGIILFLQFYCLKSWSDSNVFKH